MLLLFVSEELDLAALVAHLRSFLSEEGTSTIRDHEALGVSHRLDAWLRAQVGKCS